ncbi:hypothetical protein Br6_05028 [Rhodococcus sp. Br-6]|nr:hypothetical protein Br6_05028 [Rhodococcus sp. Br-6]
MSDHDSGRQYNDDIDAVEEERLGRIAADAVRESGERGIPLSQVDWGSADEFWERVERTMGTPEARRAIQEEHELYGGTLCDGLDFSATEVERLSRLTAAAAAAAAAAADRKPEASEITPSDPEQAARDEFQAKLLEQMGTPEARRWNQEECETFGGSSKDGLDPEPGSARDTAREP